MNWIYLYTPRPHMFLLISSVLSLHLTLTNIAVQFFMVCIWGGLLNIGSLDSVFLSRWIKKISPFCGSGACRQALNISVKKQVKNFNQTQWSSLPLSWNVLFQVQCLSDISPAVSDRFRLRRKPKRLSWVSPHRLTARCCSERPEETWQITLDLLLCALTSRYRLSSPRRTSLCP